METNFGGRNYGRHDYQRGQIIEALKAGKSVAIAREDGLYSCSLDEKGEIVETLFKRKEPEINFVSIDEVYRQFDFSRIKARFFEDQPLDE